MTCKVECPFEYDAASGVCSGCRYGPDAVVDPLAPTVVGPGDKNQFEQACADAVEMIPDKPCEPAPEEAESSCAGSCGSCAERRAVRADTDRVLNDIAAAAAGVAMETEEDRATQLLRETNESEREQEPQGPMPRPAQEIEQDVSDALSNLDEIGALVVIAQLQLEVLLDLREMLLAPLRIVVPKGALGTLDEMFGEQR